MDKVAQLSDKERRELFQETAAKRGISPAVVEKDFWVCWVLKHVFTDTKWKKHFIFKGGTSLSKVFNLIERFSEDIDLILDWQLLGYKRDAPNQDSRSKTQQDKFNKKILGESATFLQKTLVPELGRLFETRQGVKAVVNAQDPHVLHVSYPNAFSDVYLRPEILLEISPLASWVPSSAFSIRPYAAEPFPHIFADPNCPVVATHAERTFWEKATILHQVAHLAADQLLQQRYSRHYYDLFMMSSSPVKTAALSDLALLRNVVAFKQRFYPSAKANYETAIPGTFKLSPPPGKVKELEKDYKGMRFMIFNEAPTFEAILQALQILENEINELV